MSFMNANPFKINILSDGSHIAASEVVAQVRRTFHDLEGILIRDDRATSGELVALLRWNGEHWVRFGDVGGLHRSGTKIDQERAAQTLAEYTLRTRKIQLSADQA